MTLCAGQAQGEAAAFAKLAFNQHFTARLLGKPEYLRQTQPGALADTLGGIERFEDQAQFFLGNTCAGIGQRYLYIVTRAV